MTVRLPNAHICKNCGFMSPRRDLFATVGELLLCLVCVEQYAEFLYDCKPVKPV